MRKDREKALVLRLQGYSYNEITEFLKIPKSTLSNWFTGLALPDKALKRIQTRVKEKSLEGLLKKNRLQTHQAKQRALSIRKGAQREIQRISKKDLLLLGAALYWAEGYKKPVIRNGEERTHHVIGFTNSDPVMTRLFILFLKGLLKIPEGKIYASVRIYEHINENDALRYWQSITKLPKKNFRKFYYGISKSSQGKRPYNRLPFGTIQITVGDTKKLSQNYGVD